MVEKPKEIRGLSAILLRIGTTLRAAGRLPPLPKRAFYFLQMENRTNPE
jgi:hypothetical protein